MSLKFHWFLPTNGGDGRQVVGGGHHGPSEYVVTDTLEAYRQMIVQFVQIIGRNGKSRPK